MIKLKAGTKFRISGDSSEMGISGYNVRVVTQGEVLLDSPAKNKMAVVVLDEIDGDLNVCVAIKKEYLKIIC